MEPSADQLRVQIEHTRAEVARDVDELQEALQPGNLLARGMNSVKGSVRERAGAATGAMQTKVRKGAETMNEQTMRMSDQLHEGGSRVGTTASGLTTTVRTLPTTPAGIATLGLAAVAAGWGISRMLPQGRLDEDLSRVLPDEAPQALASAASETASELAQQMKEPVRAAAVSVKEEVAAAATGSTDPRLDGGSEAK